MPDPAPAREAGAEAGALSVRKAIRRAIHQLQGAGVQEPELNAQLLASSGLGCPRLELFTRMDEKLSATQFAAIEEGTRRLADHEPIQYVLGRAEFMGRVFKCDRRALIPRPETEELVEFVAGHELFKQAEAPRVIDAGTGCGCIAISLALIKKKGDFLALDVSAGAAALAGENALSNGAAELVRVMTADFAAADIPPGLDAVVTNPPYVRTDEFGKLDRNIRLWEPRIALDGGDDGLRLIEPFAKKAHALLKPDGLLFMEIGNNQWPLVQALLAETGFRRTAVRLDCAGHNRLVLAVK
ncbi:MAG: peptide chain release factor N(5)-glutamine methyltransferase [Kiritimatiellia bacterium]